MNNISIKKYTENSNHSNGVATAVDWLGHQLTYTTSLMLEEAVKIVRPFKAGFQDQCCASFDEICVRVARVALCIVFSWTLLLGIVGAGLRLLASLARREFTYIHPTNESIPENRVNQITVRTFNTGMMPECVSIMNGLRPTRDRIIEVAESILEKEDDVICMQELFHTEAADYLANQIKTKFPYIVYNVAPRSFGINSGLMIASKFPIVNTDFWVHKNRGGFEELSNKGTLAVTIQPSKNQTVVLFNSHLTSDAPKSDAFPEGEKSYRENQIAQIKEQVDNYIDQSTSKHSIIPAVLLAGDYNIGPLMPIKHETSETFVGTKPHPEWASIKDLMDPLISDDDASATTFDLELDKKVGWNKGKLHSWETKPECLDHIGTSMTDKPTHPIELLSRKIDPMNGSSDHLAVAATFAII